MGADFSLENRNDLKEDQLKFSNLSPSNISKLKQFYEKNPTSLLDKKGLISLLGTNKQETDLIFEFYDLDGSGQIDSYEFICAVAMLCHSSIELKAEVLFKFYDLDNNNYLTKDEINFLIRTFTVASKKPAILSEIDRKVDEFILNADIDLDKKLSFKEFQSYLQKNREILRILDNYSCLIPNNPIKRDYNEIENNTNFGEENLNADECEVDPDLELELNRNHDDKTESKQKIKEGAEFLTKIDNSNFKEEIMAGTEFSAVKPWKGVVLHSIPSNYKPDSLEGKQPDSQLELEFIHGYRCHDARNNLYYMNNNDFVYHTAAVGIVFNKESRTQKFFMEHVDDILSIDIHPEKKIFVTGEIGPYPLIAVWDAESMQCLSRFTSPLTKGINHVAFSRKGNYFVASAADDDHCIAVFDWSKVGAEAVEENKFRKSRGGVGASGVVASGKGTRSNILQLCFNDKGDTIAAMCVKEVCFITFANGTIKLKKGTGLKGDNLQTIMCGAYLNNTLVTGSFKGDLFLWNGSSFTKSIKAHTGAVNTIYLRENNTGFITGGNDGNILVFDQNYKILNKLSINVQEIKSLCPKVRSVCENSEGNILVGSRASEIIEFINGKPVVHLRGHYDNELWGLCNHPSSDKYYTAGQDKMLALWDIRKKSIEKYTSLPQPAENISVSPDGKHLAIGSKNGELYIYDSATFIQKFLKKDRKDPISVLKYTPNGSFLAVGGVDFLIMIYNVSKNYSLGYKLKGHVSRVTHLDFDTSSEIVQSNSTSYDILYHNMNNGKQVPGGASAYKDTEWATWSLILGWPVQGIWPPCASGDDINSLDCDKERKVIITGDDFGKVKLFRYPCPVEKASFNPYSGHSSHVTNVKFSNSNNYVISAGGNDKALFQWRYLFDKEAEAESEKIDQLDVEEHEEETNDGINFRDEEMQGTEFGASKPFLGEVKASTPKGYVAGKDAGDPPKENLKLKYVHGYRSFDTRDNLKYTYNGNVIFSAAALNVVLNKEKNTQTFFDLHEEDIVSLDIHPNKKIAASGQMAKTGKAKLIDLYVFEIDSKKSITNLRGFHLRAIRLVQFSPDGTKLLTGGQDDDNSIAVYDWANSKMICSSPVDKSRVLSGKWKNEIDFVTCGLKHIKFFSLNGRNLSIQKGIFGSIPNEALLTMEMAFENKTCVTGDGKGNLIIWAGRNANKSIKAHEGAVWSLLSKGSNLYSGGQDGLIKIYSSKFEVKEVIDVKSMTPFTPGIRSIDINERNNLLIGTKGGDIIEYANKKPKILIQSHYDGELWGLTVNPTNSNLICTGGGDQSLRIYDIRQNKLVQHLMLDQDFRAIDWSQDGAFIVVGSMIGKIYLISSDDLSLKFSYQSSFKKKEEWIQELKISPNNKFVAFGSHGATSKIEILSVVNNKLQLYGSINPRVTSAVTHLDWSSDSEFIVVNSLAFELKFMSLSSKKLVSASASLGIEWNTWTCIFGFNVQGIWPPASTGYVMNYTCLSNNKKVLATGDDFSTVKLYKNPCTVTHARYKEYRGHSSHVPKIRFSKNDTYLLSVGGNDKCVMVWETDFGTGDENEENDKNENEDEENNQMEENGEDNQNENNRYENNDENNMEEDQNNMEEIDQEMEEKKVSKNVKNPSKVNSKAKPGENKKQVKVEDDEDNNMEEYQNNMEEKEEKNVPKVADKKLSKNDKNSKTPATNSKVQNSTVKPVANKKQVKVEDDEDNNMEEDQNNMEEIDHKLGDKKVPKNDKNIKNPVTTSKVLSSTAKSGANKKQVKVDDDEKNNMEEDQYNFEEGEEKEVQKVTDKKVSKNVKNTLATSKILSSTAKSGAKKKQSKVEENTEEEEI